MTPPRVALVTGGGAGIGAATARTLARTGTRVVVCGRRPEPLERTAQETGGLAVTGDVADPADAARVVQRTVDHFGRLDGLVLNAGVMYPGALLDVSPEAFEATLRVNVGGLYHVLRAALPHLLASRGAVVTVASVAGLRASAEMSVYAASKAAATALTQSLAVDYGPQGLRANVVCPGWTATEMADAEMAEFGGPRGLSPSAAYGLVTSLVPARRPAGADEVAACIAWLLSDQARYVNAAVIPVDGGQVAVDVGTVPFDPRVSVDDRPVDDR
ncbi:SDR family NAD(P)-dependent oxidoreductase [Modestobacter sp. VKM Ac-2978]|uniref:SDR family NAD(P)-dependent oxidoreductase n=1 Tax=Modestobacter sp. VKM Ac-2978 TaxID=3004132 RepID=UPI0022AB044E|nr:SDR family oxidoreductase [Modestobacter sp. VKM Ac-2978]MCZ2850867.1 SDR family NAD(P)-dependent oxidoreductase [Modestobacter sp. VKM Ac-2978]